MQRTLLIAVVIAFAIETSATDTATVRCSASTPCLNNGTCHARTHAVVLILFMCNMNRPKTNNNKCM